jgi:uncharacterized protein
MRFIIIMLLTYLAYKFLKGMFITKDAQSPHVSGGPEQRGKGEDLVEDPCCHTYIPQSKAIKMLVQGKTVYFCSKKCLDEFKEIQEKKA